MDPLNPIAPVQPDNDSASSDDTKADDRRAERARAFQQALTRPAAAQVAAVGASAGSAAASVRLAVGSDEAPLSQALLRVRAEGYPQAPKVAGQEARTPTVAESKTSSSSKTESAEASSPGVTGESARDAARVTAAQSRQQSKSGQDSGGSARQEQTVPDPRLLHGPVSLPGVTNFAPAATGSGPGRPNLLSPELMQQIVDFATVHRNQDGVTEFQLGLTRQTLGGLRIQLSAYGNRRIGLAIRGNRAGLGESDVASLIESLRQKNIEVVDVILAD